MTDISHPVNSDGYHCTKIDMLHIMFHSNLLNNLCMVKGKLNHMLSSHHHFRSGSYLLCRASILHFHPGSIEFPQHLGHILYIMFLVMFLNIKYN